MYGRPFVLPQLELFTGHDEEVEKTLAEYMVKMLTSREISSVCSRWTCGGISKRIFSLWGDFKALGHKLSLEKLWRL